MFEKYIVSLHLQSFASIFPTFCFLLKQNEWRQTHLVEDFTDLVFNSAHLDSGKGLEEVVEGDLSLEDLLEESMRTEHLPQDQLQGFALSSDLRRNKKENNICFLIFEKNDLKMY